MILHPLGDGAGLGPLEPWHAEQFADSVAQARDHLAPWIPFAHTIAEVETARGFLQRFADARASDTRHLYGIWRDGQLVGGLMFPGFDQRSGICELGVWLSPQAQGQGLMTRAAGHLIDWAFRERGMSRVEWHTDPRNGRSRAVAKRLGFTFEGVRRSSHVVADERQDAEVWALLAREWTAPPATTSTEPVPFFDATYGNFAAEVSSAVRREAFGDDIGQNSWLTTAEWQRYLGWAALSRGTLLLDVACGSGGPAVAAAVGTGCDVVGVDRHEQAIRTATRLAGTHGVADRARFLAADASLRLPFEDGTVDVITCIDSIHHFPDRAAVLAEWRRVLRSGGHLIYTDPVVVTGPLTNEEIAVRSSIGFFQFNPADANEALLAQAGFDLLRCEDTTQNMADVADRWHRARATRRADLAGLEGETAFDGQQRFLAMTALLADQRRLSRHTLHAVA
ncbi:MAG TPA: GNAT family N-acetyltransferase [Micromonosporaceae bacterium]